VLRSTTHQARQHPIDRLATDPTIGEVYAAFRLTLTPLKRGPSKPLTRVERAHQRVKLLQFAVLMVTTMCRVGELLNLPYRDRSIDPKTKVLTAP